MSSELIASTERLTQAEADAVIRAVDVVVHRLWDGDDGHALAGEMGGEAQGAVAAQRHHRIDAQSLEDVEDVTGLVAVRVAARIEARGVEDGAAGAVDPAHALAGDLQAVRGDAGGIGGIDRHHAFPAAAEADHLPAEIVGGERHRADAGIEPRHVAASGQDADAHRLSRSGRN